MKKNQALLYGLVSLAMIIALPLIARAGTWKPLNNQPPMPDITDPQTGEFLSQGGASYPMLLTDGIVEAQSPDGKSERRELFGFARTNELMQQGRSASEIAAAAQSFGQNDDMTVLRIEFTGAASEALAR